MTSTIETTEPPKRGRGRPPKGKRALSSTERSNKTRQRQLEQKFTAQAMAVTLLAQLARKDLQSAASYFTQWGSEPCMAHKLRDMVQNPSELYSMIEEVEKMVKQAEANRNATEHQTETKTQNEAAAAD
jgi:ubiquitin